MKKKQQARKEAGKDHKTPYVGERINVQDIFDLDKAIRRQAYSRRADLQTVRSNLETSNAVQETLVEYAPANFRENLKKVNKNTLLLPKFTKAKKVYFSKLQRKEPMILKRIWKDL